MNGSLGTLLVRQWKVTAPILVAFLALAVYLALSGPPPTYEASGQVLLARPEFDPSRLPENVIDVPGTAERLVSSEVAPEIVDESARLTATAHDHTTIEVTVAGPSAGATEQGLVAAIDWLEEDAASSQQEASVPEAERLAWLLLTPDTRALTQVDGSYRAAATLWIEGLSGLDENPYARFSQLPRVMQITLTSEDRRAQIHERLGGGVDYGITAPTRRLSAPLLDVRTSGADPDRTLAAFDLVVDEIGQELQQRQSRASVPVTRRVFVDVIAPPIESVPQEQGLPLGAASVALLGVVAAGGAAASAELGWHRRFRRTRRPPPEPPPPPSVETLVSRGTPVGGG